MFTRGKFNINAEFDEKWVVQKRLEWQELWESRAEVGVWGLADKSLKTEKELITKGNEMLNRDTH